MKINHNPTTITKSSPPLFAFLWCILFSLIFFSLCVCVWLLSLQITGGIFVANMADFGGFLYKEGGGKATCTGASIVGHIGVDGGAIYAVDDADLYWECDLIENVALSGPAM